MQNEINNRCIHLDWLEVYCLEANHRFPCNADYFRRAGYNVKEREYGTRVYKEMFTITNEMGDPVVEIRRNPASGESDFQGLLPESTHIRLPNWMLYQGNPIEFLREFLVRHDYIFKRIYRIDIAYDFETFDSGDNPAKFIRRYIKGVYRKINQCHLSAHGKDEWSTLNFNSLKWGAPSSMVTTKLYDKTLELREAKNDKPWIKTAWLIHGLIDNPCSMTKMSAAGELYKPTIWRIEFALMSAADGWIVIEMNNAKKQHKQTIPHNLSLFDSPEKLWQRFQDLTFNYFHFKIAVEKKITRGIVTDALAVTGRMIEKQWQRKDRCPDKILFHFDKGHQFYRLSSAPAASPKNSQEDILKRRLQAYRASHADQKIRDACTVILQNIERYESLRFTPLGDSTERIALQRAIAAKIGGDQRDAMAIIEEVRQLILNSEIW